MDNTLDSEANAQLESGGGGMLTAPAPPATSPQWAAAPAEAPTSTAPTTVPPPTSAAPLPATGTDGATHPKAKLLEGHNGLAALIGGVQQGATTPSAEHPVVAFGYSAHRGALAVEVHAADGHRDQQKQVAAVIDDIFTVHTPAGSGWRVVTSYAAAPEGEEGVMCVTLLPDTNPTVAPGAIPILATKEVTN